MGSRGLVVVAGYLVRDPLGGYAWQAAHYLIGLERLGYDVWFYEDTAWCAEAYDPESRTLGYTYAPGLARTARFLSRLGLGERWAFWDAARDEYAGASRARVESVFRDADLLLNLAGVNRVAAERRQGRLAIYVDLDPGYTQIRAAAGDAPLRALLAEHDFLFTLGENIGTPRSPVPTAGFRWHPTRPPVLTDLWRPPGPPPPGAPYTTVGSWDSAGRDVVYGGERYTWRKRIQWQRFLELPARVPARFELAMDLGRHPHDRERLRRAGWALADPIAVSADPFRYREYIWRSRGEFTAAKDLNVRLRTGWFSDRGACYLAAGRPVVTEDTGFGDVLPLGQGLYAVRGAGDAAEAVAAIEADYAAASRAAREIAASYFRAERVLAMMLDAAGAGG